MVTGQAAAPRGHDSAAAVTGAIVPVPVTYRHRHRCLLHGAPLYAGRGQFQAPAVSRCLLSMYDAAMRLTN